MLGQRAGSFVGAMLVGAKSSQNLIWWEQIIGAMNLAPNTNLAEKKNWRPPKNLVGTPKPRFVGTKNWCPDKH